MGLGEGISISSEMPVLDVGVEFPQLREAVTSFASREERDFSGAEFGEQIRHLSQTIDMLQLEMARLVGVFAKTGEAERQGSNTTVDWVRHQAKMSLASTLEVDVVGRLLDQVPRGAAAVTDGEIGFGHVVLMARNAAFAAKSRTGAFDEPPLLAKAREESVSRFRFTCQHARHAQDPEGFKNNEVDAVESRELHISQRDDGMTTISMRLDNAAAAIAQSVLEARARRQGKDDYRLKARRMADAAIELLHAPTVEVEGGNPVGRSVHINVTCTAETLLNLPGAPAAELEFGLPISAAAVGRLACEASITKILLDQNLVPVAVGHSKRTLTKLERKALNIRDRHCRVRACECPPSQCEGHHVIEYSKGQWTILEESMLLCRRHHHLVHESGYTLMLAPEGEVTLIPPYRQDLARAPGSFLAA